MKDQSKFQKNYINRNITVCIIAAIVIILSGFLGYLAVSTVIEPYLSARLSNAVIINETYYKLADGEIITTYNSNNFTLKPSDIAAIKWVVSLICIFAGCIVASILSFFKQNNIDGFMSELGPRAKLVIMKTIQEDLEEQKEIEIKQANKGSRG